MPSPRPSLIAVLLAVAPCLPWPACAGGTFASGEVFVDDNRNGARDRGERGVAGVKLSNGRDLVRTDADGRYAIELRPGDTVFAIKPPGYGFPLGENGLPRFWLHHFADGSPDQSRRMDLALVRAELPHDAGGRLQVLIFSDPQTKDLAEVDYYARDIVAPLAQRGAHAARLGLTLGDVVDDALSLYPALDAHTASLGVPWLHLAGNHDRDLDAASDEDSLLTFRNRYGPDTLAWEEHAANFIAMDNVIHQPGTPAGYIGGLRAQQFAFLESYLPTLERERLLVVAVHIPLFDAAPRRETFRRADRERLFGLLREFPYVLLLSGHSHTQRHVYHGVDSGWRGAAPLHEYNVGAASGAYWSGILDEHGIPDASMSDGTPNGHARLEVRAGGEYTLGWHPARPQQADPALTSAMALHAPKVLRRGAYPAWAVYANVFMGSDDTRVEYRIDDGDWLPMRRVERPDPRMTLENARDDDAAMLRGFDRSPEATPSQHLWRGTLPTELVVGAHRIEVRAFDRWHGEQRASTSYRLAEAVRQ